MANAKAEAKDQLVHKTEAQAGEHDDLTGLFQAYAANADARVREKLIVAHLGLVSRLVHRLVNSEELYDDLMQVGYIGLINAIDRYDPSKGNKFSTYAIPTITGEIRRYLRDKSNIIRIPRHLQELRSAVDKAYQQLTQQLSRVPTEEEVADNLGLELESVRGVRSMGNYSLLSLDQEVRELDEREISSLGALFGQLDVEFERLEDRAIIRRALENLTSRQRAILHLLFYEDLSQAQIGELLNISQMHVSRLRREALRQLRDGIKEE